MKNLVKHLGVVAVSLLLPLCALVLAPTSAEARTWDIPAANGSLDPLVKPDEYANRVMARINKIRVRRGLRPVKVYQGCLDAKANKWAGHLAGIGKLVHRDQTKVLSACDLHWTGETLVSGTALLPGAAVTAWMHSAPHRAVIMKARANRAGVGMAVTPAGVVYCVLNFGDPT